jgi:hypothetical protein
MSGRKTRSDNRSVKIPTEVQTEFPRPPAIPVPPETDEDRRLSADPAPAEGALGDNHTTKPGSRRPAGLYGRSPPGALVERFQKPALEYNKLADEGPQMRCCCVLIGDVCTIL